MPQDLLRHHALFAYIALPVTDLTFRLQGGDFPVMPQGYLHKRARFSRGTTMIIELIVHGVFMTTLLHAVWMFTQNR